MYIDNIAYTLFNTHRSKTILFFDKCDPGIIPRARGGRPYKTMLTAIIVLSVVCVLLLVFIACNWTTYKVVEDLKSEVRGVRNTLESEKDYLQRYRDNVRKNLDNKWIRDIPLWVEGLRFKKLIPIDSVEAPPSTKRVSYDAEWLNWKELEKARGRGGDYTFHSERFKIGDIEWIVKVSQLGWSDEKWWIVESVRCENVPS